MIGREPMGSRPSFCAGTRNRCLATSFVGARPPELHSGLRKLSPRAREVLRSGRLATRDARGATMATSDPRVRAEPPFLRNEYCDCIKYHHSLPKRKARLSPACLSVVARAPRGF